MLHLTKPETTARERQLEAENSRLRQQLVALTTQLEALQAANEGHYRAQYDTTGGPRLDRYRPFGTDPKRKLGTLFLKGDTP